MDVTEPIDPLHDECLDARDAIRQQHRQLAAIASRWEPRPYPWEGGEHDDR